MIKSITRLCAVLLISLSAVGCVVVPHQPGNHYPADPPADPLGQCIQDNRRRHEDVWQQYRRAASDGRISRSEAGQFQAMERRLQDIRYYLYRDGITLYDCQRLGREISNERANVQRMAATPARDPQLPRCIQDNRRDHEAVWQLFLRAKSAGRISSGEARQFQDMERRLNDIKRRLAWDGLSLSECRAINGEIARERETVRRMAATPARDPEIGRCIQDNRRDHEDVWQLFQRAKSAGRISSGEAHQFRDMERRLNDIKRRLAWDVLSLSECRAINGEIARERETVRRMAATPARDPQIGRCIQDNRRDHEDVWQLFQRAKSAGRISPDEARHFKEMERRLSDIKQRLSRDGLTLSECQAINREIDRERNAVRRMADRDRHH